MPSHNLLKKESSQYPRLLKTIFDPPAVLYFKGQIPLWEERPWVAVVGARKASKWGLQRTKEIVSELVGAGFGIISGLAYGIDGEAHKTCVEKGGVTWGVLGSGIDRIYPERHSALAKKMEEKGGILSEFPSNTEPWPSHFPQRNRIISGLSQAVIVVEAAIKSGSLITAKFALEQGREVFVAAPPEENDVRYEGNRWLLEQGAPAYENGEQVLEAIEQLLDQGQEKRTMDHGLWTINAEPCGSKIHSPLSLPGRQAGIVHSPLLSLLKKPRSLDYIASHIKEPVPHLLSQLLQLESQGLIKKIPGALWQSL